MEKIIEKILKTNQTVYVYFKNLHSAERFLRMAKTYGFSAPEGGATCAALIYSDKHIEYVSYGKHEKFFSAEKIIRIEE